MKPPAPIPLSAREGALCLFLAAMVPALGALVPVGPGWAVGALGQLPTSLTLTGLIVLGAGLFAALHAARNPAPDGPPPPPLPLAVPAAAIGFVLLGSLLRVSTQLLGDGQLIVRNFELARSGSTDVVVHGVGSILAHDPIAPLTSILHLAATRLGDLVGGGGAGPALVAESFFMGALLAGLLTGLLLRPGIATGLKGWVATMTLLSPTILLYLGYVENYSAAHLALGLYVLFAMGTASGRVHPALPTGWLLVATGLHVQALVWWPSAVLLWWARPGRTLPAVLGVLPAIVTFGALGVALAVARWWPQQILLAHSSDTGLSLWSLRHLLDVLQTLWIVFPWLPFAAWLWWRRRGGSTTPGDRVRFALADLLVGPAVVYVFVLDPVLGAARDWDRSAFLSWAFAATTLTSLHAARRDRRVSEATLRGWLVATTAVGLVVTGAWVGLHRSADRSLQWVEEAVAADPHAHEHGFEALTRYHGDRERWAEAAHWARRAYEASGNPRLATLAAQHLRRADRVGEARILLEKAISLHPDDHRVRYELVRLLGLAGDCERTLELALEGARLHPGEPIYPFFAADCLYRLGRPEPARDWFRRCLSMEGLPPASREYAERILRELGS